MSKRRVLTVRLEITDPEKAKWIWENHLGQHKELGVFITGISEGDMFTENEQLSTAAAFYLREEGETTKEAIRAHSCEPFESVEEAARDATYNITPGAKWDVIDRHGNVHRSSE